jgi:hypothetical protein
MRHIVFAVALLMQNASQGVQYGSVSGRILAAGGAPAANVRVAVMVAGDTQQPGDVALMSLGETDSSGRYRLENVPPGRYYVVVGPVGAPLYFPGVSSTNSASVVMVGPGIAVANIDFAVDRTVAQLQAPPPRQPAAVAARGATASSAQSQILVFDRQGKQVGVVPELIPSGIVSLSPDGKRLAIARNGDIVTLDIDSGKATPITSDPAVESNPAWSPDGKRIAYFSNRSPAGVYARSADGTGAEELLHGQIGIGLAWSTDRYLSMVIGTDVWIFPATGERKPPMQILRSNAIGPRFSLDGRFVAYSYNRTEIFVRPFDGAASDPTPADKEKKISVQGGGVGLARWRADGAELYYLAANGGVMAVPISSAPEFVAGAPALLFQAPPGFNTRGNPGQLSDISADGQRFVFVVPVPRATTPSPAAARGVPPPTTATTAPPPVVPGVPPPLPAPCGGNRECGYDFNRQATVEGVVREFTYGNPRIYILLTITDDKGARDIRFSGPAPANWIDYKAGMVKPGDKIKMIVRPRIDGVEGGFVARVTTADGQEIRTRGPELIP